MRSCSEVLEDGLELVRIELAGAGVERQLVGDVRDAAQGLRAEPRRAEAGEVVGHLMEPGLLDGEASLSVLDAGGIVSQSPQDVLVGDSVLGSSSDSPSALSAMRNATRWRAPLEGGSS